MAKRICVGDSVFVFTGDDGKTTDDLIVSSHGGYISRPEMGKQTGLARNIPGLGGFIEVPPSKFIYFYGPHKMSLKDPGLAPFAGSRMNYLKKVGSPDKIRNYRLTKYQEDGGAETYADVAKFVDNNRADAALRRGVVDDINEFGDRVGAGDFIGLDGMEMYKNMVQGCPKPNPQFDVLTVHPGGVRSLIGITLNDVLQGLTEAGLSYTNIHCCFCRSRVPFDTGIHDSMRNPVPV